MYRKLLTILRGSLHTVAIVAVMGVVAFYLLIHFSLANLILKYSLETELAKELGTKVTLEGESEVDWLNQVVLNQLTIYDQQDDTLVYARRVLIAYELRPLLSHHLVLNTCQLIDFDIHAYKDSIEGPANYQFVIDALTKDKDPDDTPFIQTVDLNAILLRQGQLNYEVKDCPHLEDSPLDPNHIEIKKLSANLHLHDKQLVIKKFHCEEHQTSIKAERCDLALDIMKLRKEAIGEKLPLVTIKGIEISGNTLSGKADALYTSDDIMLNLKEIDLPYGHPRLHGILQLHASADLRISQLQNSLDSLLITTDIRELSARVDTLGQVMMTGQIKGMPCQALVDCKLDCDLGSANLHATVTTSHILSHTDTDNPTIQVKGHCQTRDFDLHQLLPRYTELGKTTLHSDFSIDYSQNHPLMASVDGIIDAINWKSHHFKDIKINGNINGQWYQGAIVLSDTLGDIDAAFNIDLRHPEQRYIIDGTINHVNPNALQITHIEPLDSISFSAQIHADLLAQRLQKPQGIVQIDDIILEKGEHLLELEPIIFEGTADRGELRSPLVSANYFRSKKDQSYHLNGRMPVANEVLEMLNLPFRMKQVSDFEMEINDASKLQKAHVEVPSIDLMQGRYASLALDMTSDTAGYLLPILSFEAGNTSHTVEGTLQGKVKNTPMEVLLQPTTLIYNKQQQLHLTGAHILQTNQGDLMVENFSLRGDNQGISASGTLGKNGDKQFVVKLDNFDLSNIFSNFEKGYLRIGGNATGELVVSSTPQLQLTTDSLKIQNFAYIDSVVGNASFNVNYQIPDKYISLTAEVKTDDIYQTHIDGDILLGDNDSLDLRFQTDHLPIGFINYWTGSVLQELSGRATGFIRLFGSTSRLQLAGIPDVDCRFTHNTIGAHFHLKDKIHLDPNLMWFKDAYVDDCHGHPLTLNAKVTHKYLKQFGYDVNLELPDNNQGFLVLDREKAPGRIYWGQLYAKGQAHLEGGNGKHRFTLKVGTTDKSWFYLSPYAEDNSAEQSAYSFLTFRDKKKLSEQQNPSLSPTHLLEQLEQEIEPSTDLQVDLKVSATEQCKVTLQIDPLSDDVLTCRGNGDLSVFYAPSQDIRLAGIYQISEGTYTMSMKGDLMRKTFQLQNTSSVAFNGVPSQAELNLDARYNIPSVNLNDLDENITSSASMSRATVPVDCKLNVTGHLASPKVGFDLELKNVSENVNTLVHNVIRDEQMLNQEVLYLLLFSKFYTPQYAQSSQSRTGSELTSFASSSITSQLNELLSKVSNNFTMGTNFRTDKGDFSDLEMDVSLSTRLLGDRLLLNGNVGYRDPANRVGAMSNSTSFIGDFDLEFLLNPSGTMRVKAYSHYNERDYSINNALTTQGIGFIFRKDFKNYLDWWPWKMKTDEKSGISIENKE